MTLGKHLQIQGGLLGRGREGKGLPNPNRVNLLADLPSVGSCAHFTEHGIVSDHN